MHKPTGMGTYTAGRYHAVAAQMHDFVRQNNPQSLHPAQGGMHQFHAPSGMANGTRPSYGHQAAPNPRVFGGHPPGFGHAFIRHFIFD
ncbi:unnamed protein product [Adineta ricciae]|uniref:Uncharacterized protein n=1 Tax=Adineta ricciae TaxID=249248 RepID=A0A813UVV3_ADIRI|nr:unnamed protein product [Adineta ricciae]CAF1456999.1 unnamed protein product [Adineta ricciae]